MSSRYLAVLCVAFFGMAGAAWAADVPACPDSAVCAAKPQTVVDGLVAAGYKAKLIKDKDGDPLIESAASGYQFDVLFYGCEKNLACTSLQFRASFEKNKKYDAAFSNKWNLTKRFLQMSVLDDTSMRINYDISTVGGVNRENFADVLDWWDVMLGDFNNFTKSAGK